MKNLDLYQIYSNATIKEALDKINVGGLSITVVIDATKKVVGTLTDGDIRRGLLSGLTLDDSIQTIYNTNPTLANCNEAKEKIIQKAISKMLYQIPIVDSEGRLTDIEDLATLLRVNKRNNRVILMAGGLGTRLKPLTEQIPKPLLKVGNKPILETIIENFEQYGFSNITISVNYKADMIKEYFGDGSRFNVNIDYIEETKRLGTAGALSLIENRPQEPFFVMNADLLTNVNFTHLLDYHSFENSMATMCVREYDIQIPYGVIEFDKNRITSIKEKPIHKFFANAGIYTLSPHIFDYIPKNQFYDMPTLFEHLINDNKKVLSFPIHEYWLDIGQHHDFIRANEEYFDNF